MVIFGTDYTNVSSKQERGQIILTDSFNAWPDAYAATRQCAHCQMHWQHRPGSGIQRGFCLRCNAVTCGKRQCETRCEPWERGLERMERRLSLAAKLDIMATGESPW